MFSSGEIETNSETKIPIILAHIPSIVRYIVSKKELEATWTVKVIPRVQNIFTKKNEWFYTDLFKIALHKIAVLQANQPSS